MAQYVGRCCQQTGPEIFTTTEELHGGFSIFYLRETGDFYTGDSASFSRIFYRLAP